MLTEPIKSIFFQSHVDWGRNLYYVQKLGNVKNTEWWNIANSWKPMKRCMVTTYLTLLLAYVNESMNHDAEWKIEIVDDLLHAIQT